MGIYTKIAGLGFFGVKEPDGLDASSERRTHINKVRKAFFRPLAHINEAEEATKHLTPENIKKDLDGRFKNRPDLFPKEKQEAIERLRKTYGRHPESKKILRHLNGANSPKGFANTLIKNLDTIKDIGNSESRRFYNGQNIRSINKLRSFLR